MSDQAAKKILEHYRPIVESSYPRLIAGWPVLSGYNLTSGTIAGWAVLAFKHTGNSLMTSFGYLGELPPELVGVSKMTEDSVETARSAISSHLGLAPRDIVVFVRPDGSVPAQESQRVFQRQLLAMGLSPMKIFLSHKGLDKAIVRRFKALLEVLGFHAWIDEDAMVPGTELERGILQGFKDSCAAIFFVTPNFKDESYLGSEVTYALQQRREKGKRFAIITLVFEQDGKKGSVPELLRPYVWHDVASEIEAFREIIRGLPLAVGPVQWRPEVL